MYKLMNRVSMKAFSTVGSITLPVKGSEPDTITSISYYLSSKNKIYIFFGTSRGYVGVINASEIFIRNGLFKEL